MTLTLCSCIDLSTCCICDKKLLGKTLVVVRQDGAGELHQYCVDCGRNDDDERDEDGTD